MLLITWYVFLACAAVLCIYHLSGFLFTVFQKKTSDGYTGPVSVVVCAHFELENLKTLIPKLLNQNYPDYEVIIVDDRSTDESYWYIKDLTLKEPKIKQVRIDEAPPHVNEKKYAITLGVKAAKNDVLLFTDADCTPASENWLAKMARPFGNPAIKVVLGFSPYARAKGFLNKFIRFETFVTAMTYFNFYCLGNPYMGVGRNMAYRKSLFLDVEGFKGYQKVLGGDDDLFVNKNAKKSNTAVVLDKEAITISKPKKTWEQFFVQKTRHLSVGKYYKFKDRLALGWLYFIKLLFWLTFLPVIVAEFEPIFTLAGFGSAMVLFLVNYIAFRRKLNDTRGAWNIFLLDVVYIFYYLSVGLKVRFTKKVRWS